MAVISSQQVLRVFDNQAPDRVALYRISKISTGDTVDLGPSGGVANDFLLVRVAGILLTTSGVVALCSVNGTVITMPSGLTNDAGYLLVWGDTN